MFDLKTLDTIIALIVVILVLSLIVQSIQSLVKKWLKLKSNSVLASLDELFKYVESQDLGIKSSQLVQGVTDQLKELGRVSRRGNPMVESIAKEELVKILEKVQVERLDAAGKKLLGKIDKDTLAKLQAEVHKWFETVMQGFEQRYARHMKTWAICISIGVVIGLNANFFEIYQNISTSDVLRTSLVERNRDVQKMLEEGKKTEGQPVTQEQVNAEIAKLKDLIDKAPVFGFSPLKTGDVSNFMHAKGYWEIHAGDRAVYLIKLIAGWAIMVMLLSVGAPFWQDALESLFGIKNLIRKKSDTRNVEDTGGQQKP